jgi:hypothetical protein
MNWPWWRNHVATKVTSLNPLTFVMGSREGCRLRASNVKHH